MAPSKSAAEQLLDKAEKKYSSSSGWFSSSSQKYEDAGDLFQQAANSFKIERDFVRAGDSFAKEAECRERYGENNEASNAWWNAAKAYKQAQMTDLAVQALTQTITFLCKAGRFRQAADREKEIAQIYLADGVLGKACESYQRAGDWYAQEDAAATANACYKDAADLHAQLGEFIPAIELFERVAQHSLSSALTKYSVKEYWLRSGLCALAANDPVTVRRNMTKWGNLDTTFPSTREAKFLNALIDAMDAGDVQAYAQACFEFDQVVKLDNWKTNILLKIRKAIESAEEDLT